MRQRPPWDRTVFLGPADLDWWSNGGQTVGQSICGVASRPGRRRRRPTRGPVPHQARPVTTPASPGPPGGPGRGCCSCRGLKPGLKIRADPGRLSEPAGIGAEPVWCFKGGRMVDQWSTVSLTPRGRWLGCGVVTDVPEKKNQNFQE